MEKHVFVSYQHADAEFAENLRNRLKEAGIKAWLDNDKLDAGVDWRTGIDQAIKGAFALVVVMTPEAKASEYVTYEWAFAWGSGVRVIPILLKETPLHPRLEILQYLNFTDYPSRPWNKLIERLKSLAEAQVSDENLPSPDLPISPEVINKIASLLVTAMKRDQGHVQDQKQVSDTEKTREVAGKIDQLVTPKASHQLSQAHVLWVDDNPRNNTYQQAALEELGIRFTISTSTEDALKKVQSEKYDAIISDMGRPPDQRAGYTLLEKLHEMNIKTPFIIYAAGGSSRRNVVEALNRGAFGTTNNSQELFELVVNAIKG